MKRGATKGDPGSGLVVEPLFRCAGRDRAVAMGSIDKYIFRTTLASFALVLVSLTGVIWITQALRGIDLMTSQGQTIITFLGITSLVIPALVLIISPIALMIAISHTLNKLATDSEIIVMNAAGFSPFRLFRPFLYATSWWRSWLPSSPPISRPTACAASSNGMPKSPPTC